MIDAFLGLALSLTYGVFSAALVYFVSGEHEAQRFLIMFISDSSTLVSLGLIAATAIIVGRSQDLIPTTIEAAFTDEQLSQTQYHFHKECFYSRKRTVNFATEMIIFAAVIFRLCHFDLPRTAEAMMMIAACAQYGLASYVGRKLRYAGMMLHALLRVPVTRNLFRGRELNPINTAVHVAATLTIMWVYVHVRGYYTGTCFRYDSFILSSARTFLLFPAVLAVPVMLMFTFFPRTALQRIYNRSIDVEVKRLQAVLQSESLNSFEKRLCLMQFSKMYREELRYSLQLTLSDLPLAITLFVMILEPLVRH
jgi:hypothetical protein